MRIAPCLAIDRHDLGGGVGQAGEPGREARGIERVEHVAQRVMRWHIAGEGQDATQEGQRVAGPLKDLDDALRPGQGAAQDDQRDLGSG